MGTKRKHILVRPFIPTMWPLMSGTCLIQEEVHSLENVRLLLEKNSDFLPHQLFSKVDMGIGFDVMQNPNSHGHPTIHFGKEVCRVVPSIDNNNKWTIANCMVAIVKLLIMDVPLLGYGKIITIEIGVLANLHQYQVTIGNFPSCNCLDFINMSTSTLGKRGKWVPCKHIY
jgi:hypothetical protein